MKLRRKKEKFMIKKTIILSLFLVLWGNIYGQIGINTEDPTSALDVNGSVRVTDNLLVGGDDSTAGSAGTAGQFLISKGLGYAPEWQTVTTPVPDMGEWLLLGSISRTDTKGGLKFQTFADASGSEDYSNNYTIIRATRNDVNWYEDTMFPSGFWREFEDFAFSVPAYDTPIRLVISFQVLIQAWWELKPDATNTEAWISYSLAVFNKQNQRKAQIAGCRTGGARGHVTEGANTPTELSTVTLTLDLPANKAADLGVFGTLRNSINTSSGYITMGKPLDNATTDDSMLRNTTMRIDVYKKIVR